MMESLGIALGMLGGLFLSPLFCFLLVKLIAPLPQLSRAIFVAAAAMLGGFVAELVFVVVFSVAETGRLLGALFFPIHELLTFASAPSLACILLLGHKKLAKWWPAAAVLCWFAGTFSIFYQYSVFEDIYGIDGRGVP